MWIFTLNKVRGYNTKLIFTVKVENNLEISAEFNRNTHVYTILISKCLVHNIYTNLFYRKAFLKSKFSCTEKV